MYKNVCSVLVFSAALAVTARAGTVESQLLRLPIFPAPIVLQGVALPTAVSEVGAQLRGGYVLFGIELHLKEGRPPIVNLNLRPGSTLGDALRQMFQQLPDYRFEVASAHLINIYPAGAKQDPSDLLNMRIARFDVVGQSAYTILSLPEHFIPELRTRLSPGATGEVGTILSPVGTETEITLRLRNATLREILNAASEATERFPPKYPPSGWVCSFTPDPALPAGGVYSWALVSSAPHDWKQQAGSASPGF